MSKYFDESKWARAAKYPDWYLRINDEYRQVLKLANEDKSGKIKNEIKDFFAALIDKNQLCLGGPSPKLDEDRKPIDTIIIHHTSSKPGYTLKRLSVTHLLNIYVPYYINPVGNPELKGKPISSNHYQDDKMVFYAYHWFIKMDGRAIRLLPDHAIGWHAGNWDVNTRSVAICLDNDYEHTCPTKLVLASVASVIKKNYQHLQSKNILGHGEVYSETVCPGNLFLAKWKKQLIRLINRG